MSRGVQGWCPNGIRISMRSSPIASVSNNSTIQLSWLDRKGAAHVRVV
jgi:hypothetical protein